MEAVTMRKIWTCREWGARPALHDFASTTSLNQVVHHMANANRDPIMSVQEAKQYAFKLAQDCQAMHMDVNGWADTGQHFTVTRDGIILEGRHGSYAALMVGHCIRGAHAYDQDTGADDNDSWGTEHEGTYTTGPMPQPQWDAAVWLQAYIALKCKLDTTKIIGHRDTGCNTACPGDWFHSQLSRFRTEAHALKLQMIQNGFR